MHIQPGQIFRDTSYDRTRTSQVCTKRTIRILSQEADGRWLAEAVTNIDGTRASGRKTRLKASSLENGYELIGDSGRKLLKVGQLPDDVVDAIRNAKCGIPTVE